MQNKRQVTVVSHTHWDRAWYVTFQEFRARLVRLVDRLLNLIEDQPDFRVFTLDGQMAVLEDYLEVRPQRETELELLCRAGRLRIGPWYVLADEFLVSPEALIRNMQLGFRIGEAFGGVAMLGYVPDGFGHVAQLPQILRGFGIDNAFFWRGLGAEGERLGTEFTWKAPDGSAVTTIWMPWGYHNISNLGYPIHWGDTSQMEFSTDLALEQIQKAVERLAPMGNTGAVLLMNGIDHEEAEPRVPAVLAAAAERFPDLQFMHGNLEEHLTRVRAAGKNLPEFSGEFRWGKYSEILQGVYATRIYLKQRNHAVETLYERFAEPLSALAWVLGADVPEGTPDLLQTGWKWLLKNHPHDDIYGSGIDQVHHEMLYRFDQAEQIAQIITRDSLRQAARQLDQTAQPGTPVLAFNPLAHPRQGMVRADLDFEIDDPAGIMAAGLEAGLDLVDEAGSPVPCQVLGSQEVFWMETLKANRKRRVSVVFPVDLPGLGFATLYARPGPGAPLPPPADWNVTAAGAENCFLAFAIGTDGGVTIHDKITGAEYAGLHHFVDVDDAGDEYTFSPCAHSQAVSTHGQPAEVRCTASGPNAAEFTVSRVLRVPAALTPDRSARSTDLVDLPLVSRITLFRGQPGLFVQTEVDNRASDHKLSVVFPTGLNPRRSFADSAFAVMPREIDLPDSTGWVEDPTPLMHQRAFTDINDGKRGLAVLNRGLPAVEVVRTPAGAQIALVLLRCVGWLSRDDCIVRRVAAGPLVPAPGAQCPGRFTFEYAILPHERGWEPVFTEAQRYTAPVLVTRADTHEGLQLKEMNITRDDPASVRAIPFPRAGRYPGRCGLFEIGSEHLALSSLHRSRDGQALILRCYNTAAHHVDADLRTSLPLAQAWRVNLNEEQPVKLRVHRVEGAPGAAVKIHAGPAEIVTFRLEFAG